jgi:biofilm PGA synthesis protein PgaA
MEQAARLRDDRRWLPALAIYERLLVERPNDPEIYRLRVLTLAEMGNNYLAWRQFQARPELFDAGQRERLEANYLARLIVWAQAYPLSEQTRLAEAQVADAAIQDYLNESSRQGAALPRRIRVDRLILLNELGRHQQVVDEYAALADQEGQSVPGYALPAVGDSFMSLKRPEDAAPVLEAALKADPDNSAVRTQLAYAYLESEQPNIAIGQLEAYRAAQPAWRRAKGAKQGSENWARFDADTNLAMLRAYTEDLPSADAMLSEMLAIAPNNADLQSSLGAVYMMRGWPSRALERFRIASVLDDRNVESRIGQVEALTVLRRDDEAISLHDQLLRDYPSQPSVQRMDQMWRNHRGWQWRAYVSGDRSQGNTGNSPLGNRDGQYGVEVQTPILWDRWRLTAGADDRWADFQQQRVHYRRQGAGVRYAYDRLDTSLSAYHVNDRVGGTGIDFDAAWRFSDTWEGGVQLRRNDAEASLQARASGITADSAGVTLSYSRSERSAYRFGASQWRYEDGNRRTGVNLTADQRLLSRPHFLLNGFAGLYASHGSRDDTPYFNPSRDGSLELGLRADQLVWRDYDHHFRHRLTVSAGPYWQDGHGSAWVPSLAYRHEWQLGMGHVLTYGVSWSRPVYDGNREERFGFDAELRWGE